MATELINSASDDYVHTLLSADSNVRYIIPKYQREYSWGKFQWEDLILDLQEEEHGRGHFLGTIICINATVNATQETRLELVDGQQRMTTLSILMCALVKLLSDDLSSLSEDHEQLQKWLNLRSRLVKDARPRLELQRQNDNDADYRWLLKDCGLLKDPELRQPSYWGVRRIAKAHRFFKSALCAQIAKLNSGEEQRAHLFDMVDRVCNSVLVKLEVKDHASAFTLFESLNNRGMELSPIDLIKNSMLMRADREGSAAVDRAYSRWMSILSDLGPSAAEQERFLRYYYNAFDPVPKETTATPDATRSNLIRLYEEFLNLGVDSFLEKLEAAAHQYGRIIDTVSDDKSSRLASATTRLQRAQGASGNALLMYLLVRQTELKLTEDDVADVADTLTSFFVRRNITSLPATYELARLFKNLIRDIRELRGRAAILPAISATLRERSSGDATFVEALNGPVYAENNEMTRFILTALEERAQTNEFRGDLWERVPSGESERYLWTIEHIFPQGENIPDAWIEMMGGQEVAREAHEQHVHRLGNLTLTGYNSSLGTKSFAEKRDRTDKEGRPVGYRNGLVLNLGLREADTWGMPQIERRTEDLVGQVMGLFPLSR